MYIRIYTYVYIFMYIDYVHTYMLHAKRPSLPQNEDIASLFNALIPLTINTRFGINTMV